MRGIMSNQDLHTFISCKLDYCDALFTRLSNKTIMQLQLI